MLHKSLTSDSLMHSQVLSSAIYLSRSPFFADPPPDPLEKATRFSWFFKLITLDVAPREFSLGLWSDIWISTFLLMNWADAPEDMIFMPIDSVPWRIGAEFMLSLVGLPGFAAARLSGPAFPPISPLPRLRDWIDDYSSEAPTSLLAVIYWSLDYLSTKDVSWA